LVQLQIGPRNFSAGAGRQDNHNNDTQHNASQQNTPHHSDTRGKNALHKDNKYNGTQDNKTNHNDSQR
jgi:hypothetical protein